MKAAKRGHLGVWRVQVEDEAGPRKGRPSDRGAKPFPRHRRPQLCPRHRPRGGLYPIYVDARIYVRGAVDNLRFTGESEE